MAELQSQVLNNITLDTKIADADQVKEFVNDSVQELSGKIAKYKAGAGLKLEGETFSLSAKIPEKISELTDDLSVMARIEEAQGTADEALLSARAAFENDVALSGALTGWVDGRGYLVPEDVEISYDSGSKNILLASKGNVTSVDCADFIKDGMLSTAELQGTVLVMAFNTTAGSEPISVELSDFVDDYGPDIEYLSGRIDKVDGEKLSRAEVAAGCTKWTVKRNGVDVTARVMQPIFPDPEYDEWSVEGSVLPSDQGVHFVAGDKFAESLSWSATEIDSGNSVAYAATRTRLPTISYIDESCQELSSKLTGWVEDKEYLTEHQSLSDYYAKSETSSAQEINDALEDKQPIGDYATSAYVDGSCEALSSGLTGWVEDQGYLTEHQDINGKANKDEMDISAGADRAVITLHTGLSVSVVTEHQSLPGKRDLSDLIYTKAGAADEWDKWIVDSPLGRFSRVILSPVTGPEGELVWAWSADNLDMLGQKYVRLVWNEDESKWTMTAGWGMITDISETLAGEWDDKSLQFVDDNDRTWTAKRYAVADTLALSGEVKQWVEKQEYLTEHQSLSDYYQKTETSSASEINEALEDKQPIGDYATSAYVNEGHGYTFDEPLQVTDLGPAGKSVHLNFQPSDYYAKGVFDECLSAVREYNSPEQVPLSAVVNAIWCLSKLQEWVTPDEPEEEPAG